MSGWPGTATGEKPSSLAAYRYRGRTGSDFPHPDGVWPDSQAFIERVLADVPAASRRKLVCDNAARLYGF